MNGWPGELVNDQRLLQSPIYQVTDSPIAWIGIGGSNSVVESQPSKLLVAGSIPVSRSSLRSRDARASDGRQASPRLIGTSTASGRGGRRVGRSAARRAKRSGSAEADVAQLAERVPGKDEVTSSILVIGSTLCSHAGAKGAHRSWSGGGRVRAERASGGKPVRRLPAMSEFDDTVTRLG